MPFNLTPLTYWQLFLDLIGAIAVYFIMGFAVYGAYILGNGG